MTVSRSFRHSQRRRKIAFRDLSSGVVDAGELGSYFGLEAKLEPVVSTGFRPGFSIFEGCEEAKLNLGTGFMGP